MTQLRVVRSEWTKLRSLRSTIWTLAAAVVIFVGFGILGTYFVVHQWSQFGPLERLTFDAVNHSLSGVFLAELAVGVLGVLVMTGEYSTGMIRATMAAVPKRLPVLWAKLGVFAVTAFVLLSIAAFAAFFAGQAVLGTSTHHLAVSLGDAGVVRAVFGAAGYVTLVGLIGVGFGTITRSTAGGISILAAVLFVIPALANVLPHSWNDRISPYFPVHCGESLFSLRGPDPTSLHPGAALLVMIGYVVLLTLVSAVLLRRRDV